MEKGDATWASVCFYQEQCFIQTKYSKEMCSIRILKKKWNVELDDTTHIQDKNDGESNGMSWFVWLWNEKKKKRRFNGEVVHSYKSKM